MNHPLEKSHLQNIPSKTEFSLIGVSSGWGATNTGTYLGPKQIMDSLDPGQLLNSFQISFIDYFNHSELISPQDQPSPVQFPLSGQSLKIRNAHCSQIIQNLYKSVSDILLKEHLRPFVLGGDQSISIGTWAAVLDYANQQDPSKFFGLIWVDAHLDAHTPQTSPSQALHGMAAAVLMGYGDKILEHTLLQPDRLVYIGARSYEEGEHDLLKKLGVKIYYQSEVDQRGFGVIFQEARDFVSRGGSPYGITLDIDAFDPQEAPGTGAKAEHGLKRADVLPALKGLFIDQKLRGFELVEFNPQLDQDGKTLRLIWDLLAVMNGGEHGNY